MKKIIVQNPKNESLVSQLSALSVALEQVTGVDPVEFDLSGLSWACPLLVLPLAAFINAGHHTFTIGKNDTLKSYFESIKFPHGIDSISDFELSSQRNKTYVPISVLRNEPADERKKLETAFLEMIFKVLQASPGSKSAVYYPVLELLTNVFEHSKQTEGYIFGQFYPKKDYLDMCIVDTGRGLVEGYKQEKGLSFSPEQAIAQAMRGNSTKPIPDRGYGLGTSKDMICKALGGGFMMVTGSAGLVATGKREVIASFPHFSWQGVIVAYRIPRPKQPVDIHPYLE